MPNTLFRMVAPLASTLLVAIAGCGQSDPCVICPDVAGVYVFVADPVPAERSSCKEMYFTGMRSTWTVEQDGSLLRLAEIDAHGTLLEDSTATFEPVKIMIGGTFEDGYLTVAGQFLEEDGRMRMEGYLLYRAASDGCRVNARLNGTLLDDGG